MMQRIFFLLVMFLAYSCETTSTTNILDSDLDSDDELDSYWWPKQAAPKAIVVGKLGSTHGENALLFSLTGLVAQANKNDIIDELIWTEAHGEYDLWYSKLIQRTGAEEKGEFDVWQLLDRYKDLVSGYILYQPESNPQYRDDMDFSYHVAVSYAGIKQAIIIDPSLEDKVKEKGFELVMDARDASRYQCFEDLKFKATRDLVVTMNPCYHNNSDLAIANKAFMTYSTDFLAKGIMRWMRPISPVVGWNTGEEYDFTQLPSTFGLFNTASDWCSNLIALSAGAEDVALTKLKSIDPKSINYDDGSNYHSFIMSDGDNMQWSIGAFVNNLNFWGSSLHGDFPLGFTACQLNLSMMAPDVYNEIAASQPVQTTVIEYGGGYQYPDLFAIDKGEDRENIQREFARQVNANMKRTGTKVFGFICLDVDSKDAIDAYQIYAEEIEDLTGMIAIQYAPYHGGNGRVMWVKNKKGVEIPVVSARYSLWQGLNVDGGGDVEKIASAINESVASQSETMDFTIVHAWSIFENPEVPGEMAGGLKPVKWCIDRLDDKVKIVSPEELLWRIRMKHNPDETLEVIN